MILKIKSDPVEFDTAWEELFPYISKEEIFDILSNNIQIDNSPLKYLYAELNKNNEFDIYHEKSSQMGYSFFITLSPNTKEIIQKHYYPNTNRRGKYAQFLYNTKLVGEIANFKQMTFSVPNKTIAETLERIGAERFLADKIMWKFNLSSNTDEMELYFDRKEVSRLKSYEKKSPFDDKLTTTA